MNERKSPRKKYLFAIIAFILPFIISFLIALPIYNISLVFNTGELLVGVYSLTHMNQFLSGWGPYIFMYFQESADYYYLFLGWSMKEVALIEALGTAIPIFIGLGVPLWICTAIFLKRRK